MASVSRPLPGFFRWAFTVLAIFAAFGAAVDILILLINPHLPAGVQFGPIPIDFAGQPGSAVLRAAGVDSNFTLTALRGGIVVVVSQAAGLFEVVKHSGLPVLLLSLVFFAVLFDLLRRLFRNVGRGESFTPQCVRLVQAVGGWLIFYSLSSALAERWFAHAVYSYLAQHADIMVSGTRLHLPLSHGMSFFPHHGFPLGSPIFWSGLLVLALSEVFRQGVALKSENDLTV